MFVSCVCHVTILVQPAETIELIELYLRRAVWIAPNEVLVLGIFYRSSGGVRI